MRWIAVGLVLVMGCAAGAEMRPRGRRNAVRIDALEKQIASQSSDARTKELEAEVHALETRVRALEVQLYRLSQQPVTAAPTTPSAPVPEAP